MKAQLNGTNPPTFIGTFHGLSLRMLRQTPEKANLPDTFGVIDQTDVENLVRRIANGLKLKERVDDNFPSSKKLADLIMRFKDAGYDIDTILEQQILDEDGNVIPPDHLVEIEKVWRAYEHELARNQVLDFPDIIDYAVRMLRAEDPETGYWRRRFSNVLVDEYQDTSLKQQEWIDLLCSDKRNLTCVGDDFQSIYGWRSADIRNILTFTERYPDARIINISTNYRSTPTIVNASNAVVANNVQRLDKTLVSAAGEDQPIRVMSFGHALDEADWIARTMESLHRDGTPWSEMAVLLRTSYLKNDIEKALIQYRIPHSIVGGTGFWEREEIKDAIAYLKLAASPGDEIALDRIINKPKRGIGDATWHGLIANARQTGVSALNVARKLAEEGKILRKPAPQHIKHLCELLDAVNRLPAEALRARLDMLMNESGYLQHVQNKMELPRSRLDNIDRLAEIVETFQTIDELAEHAALYSDGLTPSTTPDTVKIMTMHRAKGLEFNAVFLPALEDEIIPSPRACQARVDGLEEERRLFYVAMTRARRDLVLSYAAYRMRSPANPSRFIGEVLPEFTTVSDKGLPYRTSMQPVPGAPLPLHRPWAEAEAIEDIPFDDPGPPIRRQPASDADCPF